MKTFLLILTIATAFASEAEVEEFVRTSKIFTGDVYNEILLDNNDNILVSPFSVETVFALTQSGALGITGEEIRRTFHLPETKEETESMMKSVLTTIHSKDYTLTTANKVYVENNFEIRESFQKTAVDVYQAAFENVEFTQSVSAAEEINQWVAEQTEDKIKDLLHPEDLSEDTKVVLVNALYFEANWTVPFENAKTKKAVFYSPDKEVDVDLMTIDSAQFNFYESEELDAQFLEMPLERSGGASMTIVLPNKKDGIAILEKQIPAVLDTVDYYQPYVRVSLPKFRIESSIDFGQVLERLGIHAAFNPESADFSAMAGAPGELIINKVLQKTYIDVNEVGVEAAASTAIIVGPTEVTPSASKVFEADHPFFFYIKANGVILFEGRVLEPSYPKEN